MHKPPPPDPPAGLRAVPPGEWMRAWVRVIAQPSVKNVGCWCAYFADYKDGTEVRPGNVILGKVSGGLTEKTVIDALKLIRGWGLMWRYFEGSKQGRRRLSDVYRLTIPDDVLDRVPMLSPEYAGPVDNYPGSPELRTPVLRTPVLNGSEHLNSVPGTPVLTTGHLASTPYGGAPSQTPSHNPGSVNGASVEGSRLSTGEPSGGRSTTRPTGEQLRRQKALTQAAHSRNNPPKGTTSQ